MMYKAVVVMNKPTLLTILKMWLFFGAEHLDLENNYDDEPFLHITTTSNKHHLSDFFCSAPIGFNEPCPINIDDILFQG